MLIKDKTLFKCAYAWNRLRQAFKIQTGAGSQGQNSHLPLFCYKALRHPGRRESSLLRALLRSCEKRRRSGTGSHALDALEIKMNRQHPFPPVSLSSAWREPLAFFYWSFSLAIKLHYRVISGIFISPNIKLSMYMCYLSYSIWIKGNVHRSLNLHHRLFLCVVLYLINQSPWELRHLKTFYFIRVKVLIAQLCLILWDSMDCSLPGSSVHGDSPGKNTGVGCHALLQGIFLTQG